MKKFVYTMALICGVVVAVSMISAEAYQWYMIDESTMCDNCIPVEPNPYAHGFYEVHYLKHGEQPIWYNYECWGCQYSDYSNIFNQTGLWYWPQDHLN